MSRTAPAAIAACLLLLAVSVAADPVVRVVSPPFSAGDAAVRAVGPAATAVLSGCVDDDPNAPPARWRHLLAPDRPVDLDDPGWSAWRDWPASGSPTLDLSATPAGVVHVLALQAEAADSRRGAVVDVHRFRVDLTEAPRLTLREPDLGIGPDVWIGANGQVYRDIAPGQPLRFTWLATADHYAEDIAAYRWGFDVADLADPADPGWGVPPGLGPEHLAAPETIFSSGAHVFTVQCVDTGGALTRVQVFLDVVPFPDPADQLPLLVVDDVIDRFSNAWPDEGGFTPWDNDVYRDARWEGLVGDVSGFDPERDMLDTEFGIEDFGLRDVVPYRAVIWTTRLNPQSCIQDQFTMTCVDHPDDPVPEDWICGPTYVWLDAYQRLSGNLLLAGGGALANFSPTAPMTYQSWLWPIVYDVIEPSIDCADLQDIWTSFGAYETPEGEVIPLGSLLHPYKGLGVSLLDQVRPNRWYGLDDDQDICMSGVDDRKLRCVGTKAVVLDQDFRAAHALDPGFPDAVETWDVIDWMDDAHDIPPLDQPYVFGQFDELYDTNAVGRPVDWSPRVRPDGGPMLEPMWRLKTRADWILEKRLASGDQDYPDFDPVDVCGLGVYPDGTGYGSPARTIFDGATVGALSYAAVETKPSGAPDVLWGFDPARMDPEGMRRALRWVLADLFGLPMAVSNDPPPPPPPAGPPRATRLSPARPNPFNPRTVLSFELARPGRVALSVHDARGRRVAVLVDGPRAAGAHEALWDGRFDDGRAAPSGVYVARLVSDTARETRRLTLVR